MLKLSKVPEHRELLYSEIDKRFDGEYNVLIENLVVFENINTSSPNGRFSYELQNIGALSKIESACSVFKDIEKTDYFPQIYIPYFENVKCRHQNSRLSDLDYPVIVIFVCDGETEEYPGYIIGPDEELIELDFLVDEEFAERNEVWVISLNERTGFDQTQLNLENARRNDYDDYTIWNMVVKEHKESWVSGGSEVHALRWLDNYNGSSSSAGFYGGGPQRGDKIVEASRKDVKRERTLFVAFPFIYNWSQYYPYDNHAYTTVFEYDPWPTGKRTISFLNQSIVYEYRSADVFYVAANIDRFNAKYYSVSNNGIAFAID